MVSGFIEKSPASILIRPFSFCGRGVRGGLQISRASIKSQGRASNPKGEHHTGRALARVPMFERAAEGIGVGRTHPCCRLDGQDVCSRARRYKGGRIAAGVEFKS